MKICGKIPTTKVLLTLTFEKKLISVSMGYQCNLIIFKTKINRPYKPCVVRCPAKYKTKRGKFITLETCYFELVSLMWYILASVEGLPQK